MEATEATRRKGGGGGGLALYNCYEGRREVGILAKQETALKGATNVDECYFSFNVFYNIEGIARTLLWCL